MGTRPSLKQDSTVKLSSPLVWFSVLFLAVFLLYLSTLCPAFYDDDSAETIAAGITLGLQHPPSYALDTLFVRLISFLPVGGAAFRVNVASALLASLAVALFARNILLCLETFIAGPSRKTPSFLPLLCALAGALLLAFSRTYWNEALGAKGGIYLLQALLLQVLSYCFLRDTRENAALGHRRWLPLAVFFFFLGCANHWETQAVFLPILFLFFLKSGHSKGTGAYPSVKVWFSLLTFSLLSLSPLLFLPLRSHLHPGWNLGSPDHLSYFLKSIRRGYVEDREVGLLGTFFHILRGQARWADLFHLWRRILDRQGVGLGTHLVADLTWPALLLALLGVRARWTPPGRKVLLSLLAPFALLLLVFSTCSWFPDDLPFPWLLDNFLLPTNWTASFLAAVGLYYLLGVLPPTGRSLGLNAAGLLLLWMLCANFPAMDLERQTLRYDYGANLLKSAPAGSILFGEADEDDFPVYYFQAVEGLRKDVALIPTFTLFEPWGTRQVEGLHPGLGLTASTQSFPDHFARMVYALSEIAARNRDRAPLVFSYFNGPFHRYYLPYHPSLLMRPSGILLELDAPLSAQAPGLSPEDLRLRNISQASNRHESLQGILGVYRNLGAIP